MSHYLREQKDGPQEESLGEGAEANPTVGECQKLKLPLKGQKDRATNGHLEIPKINKLIN